MTEKTHFHRPMATHLLMPRTFAPLDHNPLPVPAFPVV